MSHKTPEQLTNELNLAVHSNGANGKTQAEKLRDFLQLLIDELTTSPSQPAALPLAVEDSDSIDLTLHADQRSMSLKAELLYSSTSEIILSVNHELKKLQGEFTPSVRNSLPEYINGANDGRYLFYTGGKTYAFVSAGEAVQYVKTHTITGVFVFRSNVTEPLELLHNCTYDITGFNSVIDIGNTSNFWSNPANETDCQASLKINSIIRNGNATGTAVYVSGSKTELKIQGDIVLDSTKGTTGISINNDAKLNYFGNIRSLQNDSDAIYQVGDNCATNFVGNISTNNSSSAFRGIAIYCNGGVFDFTGKIDILGYGAIAYYEPRDKGRQLLRLNLLSATSKGRGINVQVYQGKLSAQLYIKGVIDMRENISDQQGEACGVFGGPIDITFENLTILTKKGIPPVMCQTNLVNYFVVSVIGKFYTSEDPVKSWYTLQKITPFNFPS